MAIRTFSGVAGAGRFGARRGRPGRAGAHLAAERSRGEATRGAVVDRAAVRGERGARARIGIDYIEELLQPEPGSCPQTRADVATDQSAQKAEGGWSSRGAEEQVGLRCL